MDYTGHSPGFEYVPMLYEKLHYFRSCSPEDILSLVTAVIPQDGLPLQYFKSLSNEDRTVCYRAAMICWAVTMSTMVPREMQFRVVLSDFQRRDCLIAAGTGSGKTLPIALCLLLDDPSANPLTITISPLKQLQVTQESDFNSHFQIPTVTINEDTPRDVDWWNVRFNIGSAALYTHKVCRPTSMMRLSTKLDLRGTSSSPSNSYSNLQLDTSHD